MSYPLVGCIQALLGFVSRHDEATCAFYRSAKLTSGSWLVTWSGWDRKTTDYNYADSGDINKNSMTLGLRDLDPVIVL
jgi:hypothetical protein